MKIVAEFTKDTSPLVHSNDQDQNYAFIRHSEYYLNELLRYKGFVTLHDALERLGYSEERIREMIDEYGNYVWKIGDGDAIYIDVDYWRTQLGLDPIIEIDI